MFKNWNLEKRVCYWKLQEENGIQVAYFNDCEVKHEKMSLTEVLLYKLKLKHFDVVK